MRLAVDGRVLVHRPTGVARNLRGVLGRFPSLRRPGDELTLYVDRKPAGPLPGEPDRVEVVRWPLPGGDPAWRQLRLAAALRHSAADVLFCPFYTVPLACRLPRVVTIHDVAFRERPEWFSWRGRLAFSLVAPSARRALRVITVSRFSAEQVRQHLGVPADKIEVIPHGLDPRWTRSPLASERSAARAWLNLEGPYLLHLGAVTARRNVDVLVRAFARVATERSDLSLVVAGPTIEPAPDVNHLSQEFRLSHRVERREWVPEEVVPALIAESEALVYLSSYEGFGLPALEALAAGAPVVALRRASLPEVLDENAVWVDRVEPDAVAEAVEALLGDAAAAAELRRAGRDHARRFTWGRAAEKTFEVLRQVAETGR